MTQRWYSHLASLPRRARIPHRTVPWISLSTSMSMSMSTASILGRIIDLKMFLKFMELSMKLRANCSSWKCRKVWVILRLSTSRQRPLKLGHADSRLRPGVLRPVPLYLEHVQYCYPYCCSKKAKTHQNTVCAPAREACAGMCYGCDHNK